MPDDGLETTRSQKATTTSCNTPRREPPRHCGGRGGDASAVQAAPFRRSRPAAGGEDLRGHDPHERRRPAPRSSMAARAGPDSQLAGCPVHQQVGQRPEHDPSSSQRPLASRHSLGRNVRHTRPGPRAGAPPRRATIRHGGLPPPATTSPTGRAACRAEVRGSRSRQPSSTYSSVGPPGGRATPTGRLSVLLEDGPIRRSSSKRDVSPQIVMLIGADKPARRGVRSSCVARARARRAFESARRQARPRCANGASSRAPARRARRRGRACWTVSAPDADVLRRWAA